MPSETGQEFQIVAVTPGPHTGPDQVCDGLDTTGLERDLDVSAFLEDLSNVQDRSAVKPSSQGLGGPRNSDVGEDPAVLGLYESVDRVRTEERVQDRDVEAALLVKALVAGSEVSGELGLGHPLKLKCDLVVGVAAVGGGCGDWGSGLVADTNRATGDGDGSTGSEEPECCREEEREPTDALPGESRAGTLNHGDGLRCPRRSRGTRPPCGGRRQVWPGRHRMKPLIRQRSGRVGCPHGGTPHGREWR